MADYITHLEDLYSDTTFRRKLDYIRYNLGRIISFFDPQKSIILEIGPGMGEVVSYLNQKGYQEIDIVDNDQSILELVSNKFQVKNHFLGDSLIPLDKKLRKYDLIIMIQVLEHIPLDLQPSILAILYKHLKPGGHLLAVVPNAGNPLGGVERYWDYQHKCSFTVQSLKDLVRISHLDDCKVEVLPFAIPPIDIVNLLRIIAQKALHLLLLIVLIMNGGVFQKIMTPNIMLKVSKSQ